MGTEFWMAQVAAVKLEAISASAYARRHGLSVATLYYWQRKLKVNAEERGGLGNSDSAISDNLAQPKPWKPRRTEEQAHEKDEEESRTGF